MYVWQDYITGTDPLDSNDLFRLTITIKDGVPQIVPYPDLRPNRKYMIYGCRELGTDWHTPEEQGDRFFTGSVDILK